MGGALTVKHISSCHDIFNFVTEPIFDNHISYIVFIRDAMA